jgi:hypothetical protein
MGRPSSVTGWFKTLPLWDAPVGRAARLPPPTRPKSWSPLTLGTLNAFQAPIPAVKLSLAFSRNGNALANAKCIVHGLLEPNQFSTDGNGTLALSVPVTVQTIAIEFPRRPPGSPRQDRAPRPSH